MPYKMKDGRWRGCRMIGGKRRSKLFGSKTEAKTWEAEQDERAWALEQAPILTAYSAASSYLDDVQARMVRQTYVEKQSCFRLLFKSMDPGTPLESITVRQAAEFLGAQNRARGGNAANGDRKNLCAWWTWCVENLEVHAECPFGKVKRFAEVREPRDVPTVKDYQAVVDVADAETKVFLFTLLHTAARVGELFRLTWADLDFARQTVRLSTRKREGGTLENDLVPMTSELRAALEEHKRHARSVFVFCRPDGQPYTQRIHLMPRLCKRAGVKPFGFHGIRHLSASMLDAAGKPLTLIQAILRHKSATTTARYLHSLRGARAELGDAFQIEKPPVQRIPRALS